MAGGSLSLLDTDIINSRSYDGGAIAADDVTSVSIDGGTIADNVVGLSGGGMQVNNFTNARISNAKFSGNNDDGGFGEGGTLQARRSTLEIDNSTFNRTISATTAARFSLEPVRAARPPRLKTRPSSRTQPMAAAQSMSQATC